MNRYRKILRIFRLVSKAKQEFCCDCPVKRRCEWFDSPASKSTYTSIGNADRVIYTFDRAVYVPYCNDIPADYTREIYRLIDRLNRGKNE